MQELTAAQLLFNRDRTKFAKEHYSRLIQNSEKSTMYR
jgi:hypothetical protein